MVAPAQPSPTSGPWLTLARVGLRPTRPHSLAGMRIEPPPSLACAAATMPDATAAAEPPPHPPVDRPGSHGFRLAPYDVGSVVGSVPSSGTFVRPMNTKPAARNFP